MSTTSGHAVRLDTTSTTRDSSQQSAANHAMRIVREGVIQPQPREVATAPVQQVATPTAVNVGSSIFTANPYLIVVIIIGLAILVMMFFRSRRSAKTADVVAKRKLQAIRDQEYDLPPEPKWGIRDLDCGGHVHLSLPRGLEEDYRIIRRDRVDLPDDRIEYNLIMSGDDPEHPSQIHWWTEGASVHAWRLEEAEYTLDRLGTSAAGLQEMRSTGKGTVTYRERVYSLHSAGLCVRYENCRRPGREFTRWDFRSEEGSRMIRVEMYEGEVTALAGEELWLRDLKILSPKDIAPDPGTETPPPAGEPDNTLA